MSDRRRPKWIAPVVVLAVFLAGCGYLAVTLTGAAPAATASVTAPSIPKPAAYSYPSGGGSESALDVAGPADYPAVSGTIGASGGTAALPIASISKLVAALVILGTYPLGATDAGPTLTFSKADSDLYDKYYVQGATVMAMATGSTMSERDALSVMLIASACNYTEAVTTWAFGSQDSYLSIVKSWLASHHLTGTRIVESTGLDDRNVSTPADLIAIGRLALANPAIASIVNRSYVNIPAVGYLANTNDLIGTDGVNGLKTGTLDAGSDLLFSSSLAVPGIPTPLSVVGVVLEGASRASVDSNVRAMLASINAGFHDVQVVKNSQVVGRYTTPWGDDANVVAQEGASLLTWSDTPITSTVTTKHISSGSSGDVVGTMTFTSGNKTVSVKLVLQGGIAGPNAAWRVTHPAAVFAR